MPPAGAHLLSSSRWAFVGDGAEQQKKGMMMNDAAMRQVTEKEFYEALRTDNRDIMPNLRHGDRTLWIDKSGGLFGFAYPGWRNPDEDRRYFLAHPIS